MRISALTIAAAALAAIATAGVDIAPSEAKLSCRNVGQRWQVCGDARPFNKLVLGVGIRFNQQQPGLKSR